MRRNALIPHDVCGLTRPSCVPVRQRDSLAMSIGRILKVSFAVSVLAAATALWPGASLAQDPSIRTVPLGSDKTFNNSAASIVGPTPKINTALPLNLQADQLVYDTRGSRIIARGNVEVFYNNFVLTADEIIYDQNANLLTASGNAQLRDPNGNITRAERLEATAATSSQGNSRSASTCIISRPTFPVAPTTATR